MIRVTLFLLLFFAIGSSPTLTHAGGPRHFVRGDCTDDGVVNMNDPRFLLSYLYADGPTPTCFDACDADDSGTSQLADAIHLILYLHGAGPSPFAPFPVAGPDETQDDLRCRRGKRRFTDPTPGDSILEGITLKGDVEALGIGQVAELRVLAQLVEGGEIDVTALVQWEVSNPEVLDLAAGNPATVTALGPGISQISADFADQGSNVLVADVVPSDESSTFVESLTLSAPRASLTVGDTVLLTVFANYNDGSQSDVTDRVEWAISDPATVAIEGASSVVLTALKTGFSEVLSVHDGMSSNALDFVVAAPQEGITTASSVSRHGITWTFDGPHEVGQFINGDYWVVGPLRVVSFDPPSVEISGRVRNGSMMNLTPGLAHGWDSTLYGSGAKDHYKTELNVAYDVSVSRPLLAQPGCSIVSCISKEQEGAKPGLKAAAVLTVVDSAPPQGSFRPPYAGSQKPFFNISQVRTERLGNLPALSGTPDPDVVAASLGRVWLEHKNTHMSKFHHPEDNMPWYGRDMARDLGRVALLLQTNLPLEKKNRLLIRFLQIGIDLDGLRKIGMYWPGDGGHMVGRKFPILFKRVMFGQSSNLGGDPTRFSEDDQTFYVEETSPGVFNYGFPNWSNSANHPDQCAGIHKYGPGQLGMPEWSRKHWSEKTIGRRDAGHTWSDGPTLGCDNDNHRFCCTYRVLAGHFLAAYAMNLRSAWRWEPAFDYMDRYMQIAPGWHRQKDQWVEDMWDAYRHTFGGYDSIPNSWVPGDLTNP